MLPLDVDMKIQADKVNSKYLSKIHDNIVKSKSFKWVTFILN